MTKPESPSVRGPIAIESLPWREWSHGARFGGRVRHLSQQFGDAPCRYLIVGEQKPEVAVYTDSSKVMVRTLGVFDRDATRDYWDGEHADEPHED